MQPNGEFPTRSFIRIVLWVTILVSISGILRVTGFDGIAPFTIVGFCGGWVVWGWWKRKRDVRRFDREWRDFSRELDTDDRSR